MKIAIIALLLVLSVSAADPPRTGAAQLLINHLSDIEAQIQMEQLEHSKLNDEQQTECSEEIEARSTAVLDGEDALRRAEAHLIRCESSLAEATADLASVKAYQSEIALNVQSLTAEREREREEFRSLIEEELTPAINAVQGAYPIIDEFENSQVGFLQLTRHMTKTFKTVVKAGHGERMAGALAVMATMGTKQFDAAAVQEVRQLFQKLEEDLITARNNAITVEETREKVFQGTMEEFAAILEKLNKTQEQLTQYQTDMDTCVVQENGIIEAATAKVTNNRTALKYALKMCNAFTSEYEEATAGRKAELELLGKLKEFIIEQAEIFGQYGAESTNVFEDYKASVEGGDDAEAEGETLPVEQVNMFIQMRAQKNKAHQERMANYLAKKGRVQQETPDIKAAASKVSTQQGYLRRRV